MKKRANHDIDWEIVYAIQRKSFHGTALSDAELDLCRRAINVDLERYRQNAADIKEEYRQTMRSM